MASPWGWEAILPVQESGTACNLTLPLDGGKLQDVLFGDVWFCSGQSNMEQKMADIKDADLEMASSMEDTEVRFVDLARRQNVLAEMSEVEEVELVMPWSSVKDADAFASMSAICFLTGRYWHRHLGIPIGLVSATWGGTEIEAWMSRCSQSSRFFTNRLHIPKHIQTYIPTYGSASRGQEFWPK